MRLPPSGAAPEITMPRVHASPIFDAIKSAGPTQADSVMRITALAKLMDSAFPIPGTRRTVGLDALLGLVPVVGDLVSTALSSYIIWEARQLGLPSWKIARMIGNVAVDATIGAVPLVGDLFDVAFKANQRNVRIVLDHLEKTGRMGPQVIDAQAVRIDERPR
jgi:hypothetical protein